MRLSISEGEPGALKRHSQTLRSGRRHRTWLEAGQVINHGHLLGPCRYISMWHTWAKKFFTRLLEPF